MFNDNFVIRFVLKLLSCLGNYVEDINLSIFSAQVFLIVSGILCNVAVNFESFFLS